MHFIGVWGQLKSLRVSINFYHFGREREVITVERKVQYEVLKEKWRGELESALSSAENSQEERERLLNPSYCINNNTDDGLADENSSIEIQQQLMFAKIEAQVIWK